MTESMQLYLISGVSAIGLILLSAIYSELKSLTAELKGIVASQASHLARIDSAEKTLEKLPCVRELRCPAKE